MLQQSQSNKSGSLNSEFRTSMLRRLHSLRSPGLEDSMSSSALSCNSLSSVSSSTTSSSRRRRFYQSPGLADALSPAVPGTGTPRQRVRSLGSVLEERAQLVKKNLTLNSHDAKMCSTPLRMHFTTSRNPKDTAAAETTKQSSFDNPLPSNHSVASEPALTILHTPEPKRQKYNSLVILKEEKRSGNLSRNQRSPAQLLKSESLSPAATLEDIKLEQFSLKRGKGRLNREVLWIQLTCTLIKNLVYREPLSSDDMFKCRCLQMALGATKVVDPVAGEDWLSKFSDRITDLIQEVEKCSLHTRLSRSHNRNKKLNVERAETIFSDEIWTSLMKWLRSARPHLLERLSRSIKMLA